METNSWKLINCVDKQYLYFEILQYVDKKTYNIFVCSIKSDELLGKIAWYGPWRKYVFYPESDTLFDPKCLAEITEMLNKLMEERKHDKKKCSFVSFN